MTEETTVYTAPELARLAGVTARTITRWCESGELDAYRYGIRGRWRITSAAWEAFKRRYSKADQRTWQERALAHWG